MMCQPMFVPTGLAVSPSSLLFFNWVMRHEILLAVKLWPDYRIFYFCCSLGILENRIKHAQKNKVKYLLLAVKLHPSS